MDTQKKEPNFPYCNLNIITPVKTVRDMNMKCPLFWKIETLKKFIRQHHEDFFEYFKQNSWSLVLGGKTLEEDETVENMIKKNKIENLSKITLFMQFHPNSKIKKGPHEELYEKEKSAKSHLLESLLLLDFRSKLLLHPASSHPSPTTSNLKDPLLLASLPLMSPYFAERTKELKVSFDEQKNPFRKEEDMDVSLLKGLIFDVEGSSEFRTFKYTLMARMAAMFIFFCVFFRNPAYIIAAIIVIQIYYTITMKNKLRKMKKKEEDRLDAFLKSKSSISTPHSSSLPPPPPSASPPPPLIPSQSKSKSISFFSRFYEMIICFVSSLYPTWDLDIYIEDHKREEERRDEWEREGMKKEGRRLEKKEEKTQEMSRKEGKEESWRGSIGREQEQDESEEGRREEEGGEEEKKEGERREKGEEEGRRREEEEKGRRVEEDFDPTDNINPQNFGLIEKMRLLHELRERMQDEEQNSVASAPEEGEERREEEVKRREEEGKGKSQSYSDFEEMSPE